MTIRCRGSNEVPNKLAQPERGGSVRVPLRDSLFHRLISGELRVKDAEGYIEVTA